MTATSIDDKRAREAERKRQYRARAKMARNGAPAAVANGPISLLDPKPEEYADVEELHPCAVTVCLACYFSMAYRELPPQLPRQMLYDGTHFSALDDRRTNEIVLSIKPNAFDRGATPVTVRRFKLETFRRIYVEA